MMGNGIQISGSGKVIIAMKSGCCKSGTNQQDGKSGGKGAVGQKGINQIIKSQNGKKKEKGNQNEFVS